MRNGECKDEEKRTALTVVEDTKKIDKFKDKKERVCK